MDWVELDQVDWIDVAYGLDISRFGGVVGLWSWYLSRSHSIATKLIESHRLKELERTSELMHLPSITVSSLSSLSVVHHLRGCFPYPVMLDTECGRCDLSINLINRRSPPRNMCPKSLSHSSVLTKPNTWRVSPGFQPCLHSHSSPPWTASGGQPAAPAPATGQPSMQTTVSGRSPRAIQRGRRLSPTPCSLKLLLRT